MYLLKTEKFENISPSNYRKFNFTTSFVCSNDFYVRWYCPSGYGNGSNVIIQDYYYTVHYYFYFSVLKNYYLFDCKITYQVTFTDDTKLPEEPKYSAIGTLFPHKGYMLPIEKTGNNLIGDKEKDDFNAFIDTMAQLIKKYGDKILNVASTDTEKKNESKR